MKKLLAVMLGGLMIIGAGCIFDNSEDGIDGMDGNAGFVASEISAMGKASLPAMEAGLVAAKTAAAAAETTISWSYDSGAGAWIGESSVTNANGTATRYDTLKFQDTGGNAVMTPTLAGVSNVIHNRRGVLNGSGGNDITVTVQSTGVLSKTGSDTSATINGTGGCKFNSIALSTTTVTDVVFTKQGPQDWGYPQSGTVDISRPARYINITFTGGNTADVIVTNRFNSSDTHSFKVNLDTGREYEE